MSAIVARDFSGLFMDRFGATLKYSSVSKTQHLPSSDSPTLDQFFKTCQRTTFHMQIFISRPFSAYNPVSDAEIFMKLTVLPYWIQDD